MAQSASAEASISLSRHPQWRALLEHAGQIGRHHLRELLTVDSERGDCRHAEAAGEYLDYSKQRVTDETPPLAGPLSLRAHQQIRASRASPVYC